jgi:hypothetical protein
LGQNALKWAEIEVALLGAETSVFMRRMRTGCIVLLAASAAMTAMFVCLSEACVAALAPVLGSTVFAALVVSLALFALVVVLGFIARHVFVSLNAPGSSLITWMVSARREDFNK